MTAMVTTADTFKSSFEEEGVFVALQARRSREPIMNITSIAEMDHVLSEQDMRMARVTICCKSLQG